MYHWGAKFGGNFYFFLSPFLEVFKITSKGLYHFKNRKSSNALFVLENNNQMAKNEGEQDRGEKMNSEKGRKVVPSSPEGTAPTGPGS